MGLAETAITAVQKCTPMLVLVHGAVRHVRKTKRGAPDVWACLVEGEPMRYAGDSAPPRPRRGRVGAALTPSSVAQSVL